MGTLSALSGPIGSNVYVPDGNVLSCICMSWHDRGACGVHGGAGGVGGGGAFDQQKQLSPHPLPPLHDPVLGPPALNLRVWGLPAK